MFTFTSCDASFKCKYKSIYLACRITGITKFIFHNPHLHVHFVLRKLTQLFLFYSLICPCSTHTLYLFFPCSPSPKGVTLTLFSHTGNGILAPQSQRMGQGRVRGRQAGSVLLPQCGSSGPTEVPSLGLPGSEQTETADGMRELTLPSLSYSL